jgi:hypothetical protein
MRIFFLWGNPLTKGTVCNLLIFPALSLSGTNTSDPVTISYCFTWYLVPFLSPLMTRRATVEVFYPASTRRDFVLKAGTRYNSVSARTAPKIDFNNSYIVGWRKYPFWPHGKHRSSVACGIFITLMSPLLYCNLVTVLPPVVTIFRVVIRRN